VMSGCDHGTHVAGIVAGRTETLRGVAPGARLLPIQIFSRFDEFARVMWGVDYAADVGRSEKLHALFGTTTPVEEGRLYGSVAAGTARVLHAPPVTHPGDHISTRAVGHAADWFARTLQGGAPRPASDQIWMWKELGTLLGLLGFATLLLGLADLLLRTRLFAGLHREPEAGATPARRWSPALWATAFIPVLIYFPAFALGALLLPPSALAPQSITNQIVVWMAVSAVLTLLIDRAWRRREPAGARPDWLRAVLLALAVTTAGYLAVVAIDRLFRVDFRFWVVAVRPLTADQFRSALLYVWPITAFFLIALDALQRRVRGDYVAAVTAMAIGFVALLAIDYAALFATGRVLTDFDPLSTVIAFQFVPLLAFVALMSSLTYRRTGSAVPGALICGLLVTWYVVAGTATHVV